MPDAKDARPRCKDCVPPESKNQRWRPAPHPGPRCASHWRDELKRRKGIAHGRRILATYGITAEEYWALYEFQGGKCFICQRATGKNRRLAVDHDHRNGHVRGILCAPCNSMLALARDEWQFFVRAIGYLTHPPAARAGIHAIAPEGGKPCGGQPTIPVQRLPEAGDGDFQGPIPNP